MGKELVREQNHHHYYVEDHRLWESYLTIRGMRNRYIMEVDPITPDIQCVGEEILKRFEKEYDQYNKPGEVLQ